MSKSIRTFTAWLALNVVALLSVNDAAAAPCEYYFTWSCSGCAKIGARTTGKEGPFPTQSVCESAASSMRSNMDQAGGGVTINGCTPTYYTCGDDAPSPPSGSGRGQGAPDPGYTTPTYDYEAERLAQEERERQERAEEEDRKRREQEAREKFEQDKQSALKQMKGTQNGALELKGGNATMGTAAANPLKLKPGDLGVVVSSPGKAFACAAWIANHAFPAARKGDVHEVRHLRQQVERTLKGETPGIDCPKNLKSVPEITNAGPLGPGGDLYRFYDKLLNATATQAEKIDVSQRALQELGLGHLTVNDLPALRQQLKDAQKPSTPPVEKDAKQVTAQKPEVKQIEKETAAQQKVDDEKKKAGQEKKRRALEEAKKALEEAKRAESGIDDLERMNTQVNAKPSLAGAMTKQIPE